MYRYSIKGILSREMLRYLEYFILIGSFLISLIYIFNLIFNSRYYTFSTYEMSKYTGCFWKYVTTNWRITTKNWHEKVGWRFSFSPTNILCAGRSTGSASSYFGRLRHFSSCFFFVFIYSLISSTDPDIRKTSRSPRRITKSIVGIHYANIINTGQKIIQWFIIVIL